MVVGIVVLKPDAPNTHETVMITVYPMEVEKNVMKLVVIMEEHIKAINVSHMEVVEDVLKLVAIKEQHIKVINVSYTDTGKYVTNSDVIICLKVVIINV